MTAMRVNAFAVRSLATAARERDAVLVHYGTDFVFDGDASEPYAESVPPGPQSVYATSKLLGEWFAVGAPRHYILRVESLFGGGAERTDPGDPPLGSTLDRMVNALEAGRPISGFTDRIVSPSYVPDVAAATAVLVATSSAPGLYHCVNTGHASWYDVALAAARRGGGRAAPSAAASAAETYRYNGASGSTGSGDRPTARQPALRWLGHRPRATCKGPSRRVERPLCLFGLDRRRCNDGRGA